MSLEELIEHIGNSLGSDVTIKAVENTTPECIEVGAKDLMKVMSFLHEDDKLYFDSLSCITGIDLGPETGKMEVIYNLYSIPFGRHLMVKVTIERDQPRIASLCPIWKAADWHEREAYDLLGIHFEGHPDLRRILMPADWDGYPLRKDYQEQKYYRGVKVEY